MNWGRGGRIRKREVGEDEKGKEFGGGKERNKREFGGRKNRKEIEEKRT